MITVCSASQNGSICNADWEITAEHFDKAMRLQLALFIQVLLCLLIVE